ncbi:MAG: T9SS type A sorting domain-containing protein [bacterium]
MQKFIYKMSLLIVAVTIVASSNLEAEIIYTDLNPDKEITPSAGGSQGYSIDFNSDKHIDISFQVDNLVDEYKYVNVSGVLRKNQIAGDGDTTTKGEFFPLCFVENELIGDGQSYKWYNDWDLQWEHALPITICGYGLNSPGHWAGGLSNRYLGIRFYLNGNYHYGWVAIEIPTTPNACTFKGYAYESEPNKPILAGQQVTGIDKDYSNGNNISISPNPATDNILISLPISGLSTYSISIFNTAGIEIISFTEQELSGKYALELSTEKFLPGIYYCSINSGIIKLFKSFIVVK